MDLEACGGKQRSAIANHDEGVGEMAFQIARGQT
jgi:hypothetical protein